jgi:hypothetical protein
MIILKSSRATEFRKQLMVEEELRVLTSTSECDERTTTSSLIIVVRQNTKSSANCCPLTFQRFCIFNFKK